jgi:hypothetical protein
MGLLVSTKLLGGSIRAWLLALAASPFALAAAQPPSPPPGPARRAPEYALKAAFLYNFTLFVEWPEETKNVPLVICVLGEDPFGSILPDSLRGKMVRKREVRSAVVSTREELLSCAVVYVPATAGARERKLLTHLAGRPVLTVGESDDFLDDGGVLRFFFEGEKLRFEASAEAARRSGVRVSAQLLDLSRSPRKGR